MNRSLSIYLDFVRFSAALLVFFFHAKYDRFDGQWLAAVGAYGHDAVIIFFVLSGFVVSYVSTHKEPSLAAFATSRLARLYSVIVPALLLTLVADSLGKTIDPDLYAGNHYQDSDAIPRILANLLFLNEIWFSSWRPFSNGPFWSLGFEFWYYVIFATLFYLSGWRRLVGTAIATLIAGPKILLLLPVWAMGVLLFRFGTRIRLGKAFSMLLTLAPIVLYALYREFELPKALLRETVDLLGSHFVFQDLRWSRRFVSDYIVGLLFSVHVLGIISLSRNAVVSPRIERPIRYLAGMTFALYLMHYPLLQLFSSISDNSPATVVLTLLTITLLAPVTEGRKREWRQVFERAGNILADQRRSRVLLRRAD